MSARSDRLGADRDEHGVGQRQQWRRAPAWRQEAIALDRDLQPVPDSLMKFEMYPSSPLPGDWVGPEENLRMHVRVVGLLGGWGCVGELGPSLMRSKPTPN